MLPAAATVLTVHRAICLSEGESAGLSPMYGVRPACWLKNSAFLGYSSASETDIAGVASLEIADESEAIPWGSLSSE